MRARTARFLGVTALATGACLAMTGTASAVEGPNGLAEVIAAAGSDTTQDITAELFRLSNAAGWNTDKDNFVNVPPQLASGGSFTVPADPFADEVVYTNPGNLPPNGSSAGKAALRASVEAGNGAIDVARSSSGPSSSDPAEFEYYGFASDGVSYSVLPTGAAAGVNLSLTQLRGIYDGSITNWNQVGGADAAIQVYLPQAGSGTLSFFTGTVLGFDPTTKPVTIKRHQEHDAAAIPAADRAAAITPFSVAQFVAQGNGIVTDKRAGFDVRPLSGAGYDGALYATEGGKLVPAFADTFLGARTVYHIVDTRSVSYGQAVNAVGFDASGPSPLCAGTLNDTLELYGFKPLTGGCTLS
ncbi:substrate-binding domain-containing protein [Amycolatopsis suaedae]|uniref:Phosphate ABC transporter substrate-binding protein n=1 Tax=Amycolatopsis suaedae TaxID=2510978 RepID=A0A4Q7IXK5_9PSEU|nr:substrate-binding domain-containing protein [Amycolatopsis suaedae]RZQ59681.1 phosphate ABC transporter substrate-binding protein [Amycolatopsis suaedae]